MSEQLPETGVLPVIYENLHLSPEVVWAVEQSSEKIPHDRVMRIAAYLTRLDGSHGLLGGSHERKTVQVKNIAGKEATENQLDSFQQWIDYINSDDASYPVWFRYFVVRSLTKMGSFDRQREKFKIRSKTTRDPYPELNPEALALTYAYLNQGEVAGFNSLYGHAISTLEAQSKQFETDTIVGTWRKYNQEPTDANQASRELANSLQGFNTMWCTATGSAPRQLAGGDFYVFYSDNGEGEHIVPRLAIRMEGDRIGEIRGVDKSSFQGVELELYSPLIDHLATMELIPSDEQKLHNLRAAQSMRDNLNRGMVGIADLQEAYLTHDQHGGQGWGAWGSNDFYGIRSGRDTLIGLVREAVPFMSAMQKIFNITDHNDIFQRLNDYYPEVALEHFYEFEDLEVDVLASLHSPLPLGIEITKRTFNLSGDHTELANKILNYGQPNLLAAILPYLRGVDIRILYNNAPLLTAATISSDTFDLSGDHTEIAQCVLKAKQEPLFYSLLPHLHNVDITIFKGSNINSAIITQTLSSFRITKLEDALPYIGPSLSNDSLISLLERFDDEASQSIVIGQLMPYVARHDVCCRAVKLLKYVSEAAQERAILEIAKRVNTDSTARYLFANTPNTYHTAILTTLYGDSNVSLKRLISYVSKSEAGLQIHLAKLAAQDGRAKRIATAFASFSPEAKQEIARLISLYGSEAVVKRLNYRLNP